MSHKPVELGHVPWANYSHEQLWHMVMSADPAALLRRSEHLNTVATDLGRNAEDVRGMLDRLLATWSGGTADQVAAVVRPVLQWMAESAGTGTEVAARLGHFAETINRARDEMPYPVHNQVLDAAANGQTVSVANTPDDTQLIKQIAAHTTATPAQAHAAKAKAVEVMHRYDHASAQAYHGMPTFTKPPAVLGVTVPHPTPPPQPPPIHPPPPVRQPPPIGSTTTTSSVTTPSDFTGSAAGGATGFGGPGGLAGSAAGGLAGSVGGGASAALPGAVSGAGMVAATEGELAAMNAAQAEQAGWSGFAPMGAGGQRGAQDGEHRDRYAGRPDLIGELPPAFPPVLGL
jgi:hypothetical protein